MKNNAWILVLPVILIFFVASCQSEQYDDGYWHGYDAGYEAAIEEMGYDEASSDDFDAWYGEREAYDQGKIDGMQTVYRILKKEIFDVCSYSINDSPWSAYEASQIVGVVHGFLVNPEGEPMPTQQEYKEAVETLFHFYMYFETREYTKAFDDLEFE